MSILNVLIEALMSALWNAAEQAVYTNNPRLIYLRLTVDEHTFALATLRAPQPQRDAHIELTYPLHYYFEARPEARQRYELAVAQLPGFTVDKTRARILLTESWGVAETVRLLQILITLAGDSRALHNDYPQGRPRPPRA